METGESGSNKYRLTKLNGANYPAWKFKMRMLLVQNRLWANVTGVTTVDTESLESLSLIELSIEDSQIVHVQECVSGKQAWDKLKGLYENTSMANRMHLMEELMTSKMSRDESAQVHIAKLRRISGQLGTLGSTIGDAQYKIALLRSLPSNFENLVITLENLADALSVEDMHSRILREEARQVKNNGNNTQDTLFQAKQIICHFCKKKGHKKFQCFKWKQETESLVAHQVNLGITPIPHLPLR